MTSSRCLTDTVEVQAAALAVHTNITHQPKLELRKTKARTDDFSIFTSLGTFIKFKISATTGSLLLFFFFCFPLFLHLIWLEDLLTQFGPLLMWNQFQQRTKRLLRCFKQAEARLMLAQKTLGEIRHGQREPAGVLFFFLPPITAGLKRGRRSKFCKLSNRPAPSHDLMCTLTKQQ